MRNRIREFTENTSSRDRDCERNAINEVWKITSEYFKCFTE